MIDVSITVDAESSKELRDGAVVHLDVAHDVEAPLAWLEGLDVPLTVFLPLGELARTWTGVTAVAERLGRRHDVGVHLHRPFGDLDAESVAAALAEEAERIADCVGRPPVSVRAGAFATGDQGAWIAGAAAAGLRIDSSVVPGASTEHGWEGRRAAQREGALFGGRGVAYDYRGAPAAGVYRASAASLAVPGDGPLLEAPVAALFHDTEEPRALVLDVHTMSGELLVRGLEWIDRISDGSGAAVVLVHSYSLVRQGRPTVVGRRVEAIARWAQAGHARLRTLAELADEPRGPVWALDQDERWAAVDRSDLVHLVVRPVVRLGPCVLDARVEHEPFYGDTSPARGSRYVRAALSVSGAVAAAAFVFSAAPLAALLRRLRGLSSRRS